MIMKLSTIRGALSFVNVYAPNQSDSTEVKDAFYEQLNNVCDTLPNCRTFIVGDLNAHTGRDYRRWWPVIGKFGQNHVNSNGTRLLSFCQTRNLQIRNSFYQHRVVHRITWQNKLHNSIIDYFIAPRGLAPAVLDVRVFRSAEFDSDHFLLVATMKLRKQKITRKEETRRLDGTRLKDIKLKTSANKDFNTAYALKSFDDNALDEDWFRLQDTAKKVGIRFKMGKSRKKEWISDFTMNLIDEKRSALKDYLCKRTNESKKYLKTYRRLVQKHFRQDKEEWLRNQINDFEKAWKKHDFQAAYQKVKFLTGKRRLLPLGPVKNKQGIKLVDINEQLNEWADFYEMFFAKNQNDIEAKLDYVNNSTLKPPSTISWNALEWTLKRIKAKKAPGPNGIQIDIFKSADLR